LHRERLNRLSAISPLLTFAPFRRARRGSTSSQKCKLCLDSIHQEKHTKNDKINHGGRGEHGDPLPLTFAPFRRVRRGKFDVDVPSVPHRPTISLDIDSGGRFAKICAWAFVVKGRIKRSFLV